MAFQPSERLYGVRRHALMELLRERGIKDERVLEAMGRVRRHVFMDEALRYRAYHDVALPIGSGQTISQPFTVAFQTACLAPQPGERILEIGTGSGYQAAVLAELDVRLFSVERHQELSSRASSLLRELGYRVTTRCGDGSKGWTAFAPYDGIIVTAGAPTVPEALRAQLRVPTESRPGGRMLIPVGARQGQTMQRVTRTGPDTYQEEELGTFRFVPLVGE
ncbi:MAG: protein-L-isoaspartate(D-aspartate) O-methyltransferase [Bacteroidota bacterium]